MTLARDIVLQHFGMLSTNPEASLQMLTELGYQMKGPIKFNFAELQKFQNVGQMCDNIVLKLSQAGA